MATPFAVRSRITLNRTRTSGALNADVGSSMIKIRAFADNARAISTSCC